MQNYKIIVSYDGTDFNGWQVQPNAPTICSTLQTTFYYVFGRKIKILGASRTDSGVHAFGQVATFKTDLEVDSKRIMQVWNNALPESILIRSLEKIDNNFHPLVGVIQKTYYYDLFLSSPIPFVSRYGFYYEFIDSVDMKKFEQSLQLYVGRHDFASFCKIEKGKEKNMVRVIDNINLEILDSRLRITIKGKSFLRFQIRRMIGYALDVSRRPDLSIDYIKNMLNNPDSRQKLLKADAKGLCLKEIIYE